MKIRIYWLACLILFACNNEKDVFNNENESSTEVVDLETKIKRHVEACLKIPGNEKYTLEIFKHKLNEDQLEDALVLVNRKDFALAEAARLPNTAQQAQTDFMGPYNFVFYYDGQTDRVTQPITIASSALQPLKVEFKPIQTEGYDDFVILHRIKEAGFKSVFTVKSGIPFMVFQWKEFDYLTSAKPEYNFIGYAEGSKTLAKDILIMEGKRLPTTDSTEVKIGSTGILNYRFFYDPKQGKYATNDQPKEN